MQSKRSFLRTTLIASAVVFAVAGCSSMKSESNTTKFAATMSASEEVPPNNSAGSGNFEATLNRVTNMLAWRLSYTGLSGNATAGHLHGPAGPGQNAGVQVPFANIITPMTGESSLTPAQAADLMAGRYYINIHTAQNPGGEIRGQVRPLP